MAAGEAFHSYEAKDIMKDRESLFAIDGVTARADCDANSDFDNANKLNLMPVFCFSNALVTCEIKLFCNNFSALFTCNH